MLNQSHFFFRSLPPSASKTNRNIAADDGVHANETEKSYEASSKRLGSHSECQFDIFDQLRKRIKQSFSPSVILIYVRLNQSNAVHKKLRVVFHCAVNISAVQALLISGH